MQATMERNLDELVALLDRRVGVDCLWVYGSEADGRARADSDLDVAVLFRTRPSALDLAGLQSDAEAVTGRPVDLVDLDQASPILAYQVLRHGRLVVDRNPSRRHRFTAGVPGRREDVLLMRRPIEERLIRRVLGGSPDG
ncbi:MAG: type VII toxin-antitoxin system MntA family adenylyltransferase antitoxin [Thermoanaerobaculia bacterium]